MEEERAQDEPSWGETMRAGQKLSYQLQYRRCGRCDACASDPEWPGHGPYWYGYWRDRSGKLHSLYFGRVMPLAVTPSELQRARACAGRQWDRYHDRLDARLVATVAAREQ